MKKVFKLAAILLASVSILTGCSKKREIKIMASGWTELKVQAKGLAMLLEDRLGDKYKITYIESAAGEPFVFEALRKGDIDIKPTHAANMMVIATQKEIPEGYNRDQVWSMAQDCAKDVGYSITARLGSSNDWDFIVSKALKDAGIKTASELAAYSKDHPLRGAASFDIFDRDSHYNYKHAVEAYGINLESSVPMDYNLMYTSLNAGELDFIIGGTSEGYNYVYDVLPLYDDKEFWGVGYLNCFTYKSDLPEDVVAVINELEGTANELQWSEYVAQAYDNTIEYAARYWLQHAGLIK